MRQFRITPLAQQDLREIRTYIARDNPRAASTYVRLLRQKCRILAENPKLGISRDEYLGLYKFPVGNYLIFYRPARIGIEIIRILHAARDIERVLSSGH